MSTKGGALREIVVPVSVFGALRAELEKEAGPVATVHALHSAGYAAGVAAAASLAKADEIDPRELGVGAFWSRLSDFLARRGWGTLRHEPVHAAVGVLASADWAEATETERVSEASCYFSTGFLSGMLSELAGSPVAVLEVGCLMRGGDACRFAFGSEGAIHELYGRLVDQGDLGSALEAL